MGRMKQIDAMLQQMEQDVLHDGAIASCAMEGITSPRQVLTTRYTMDDLIDMFGTDFAPFGELIVGSPACEFCWQSDGSDQPADEVYCVPELREEYARDPDIHRERDGVLFTCYECDTLDEFIDLLDAE